MYLYSSLTPQSKYQIAEMKEETNESSNSMERSNGSEFYVSKYIRATSISKPIPNDITIAGQPSQYLLRQPTTTSIVSPMYKSNHPNTFSTSNTDAFFDEIHMVDSKNYIRQFSMGKTPITGYMNTSLPIQKGFQPLNSGKKQVQFKDEGKQYGTQYTMVSQQTTSPTDTHLPYGHSYSLNANPTFNNQIGQDRQINELKVRNTQLETMVANLKVELSKTNEIQQLSYLKDEKIRELQWKLDRQTTLPLSNIKRVLDTNENLYQELSNIDIKQENRHLKERLSSLEYDLKLAYSQSQSQKMKAPTQLEQENQNLIKLIEEIQKENQQTQEKLLFAQPYKDKYNSLLAENQNLRLSLQEYEKSKTFGCFC